MSTEPVSTEPVSTEPPFAGYGTSHWTVLALTVLGAAALVGFARRGDPGRVRCCCLVLAALTLALNVVIEVCSLRLWDLGRTLPLQLSDLAPYAAALALCTRSRRASALTYYWGLALSTQALLTPVLRGPDFPSVSFLAFFAIHVLVVWAAILLTWGVRVRPDWSGYRFTSAVTACWAVITFAVNRATGADYGFLNAKPSTGSVLDLLGPWPWYLLPEAALVLGGWALMTLPWRGVRPEPNATPAGPVGDRRPPAPGDL